MMEAEQIKQRNAMLESDNRLLKQKIVELRKELKILDDLYTKEKKTSAMALDKLYELQEKLKEVQE